jgi:hypothetical protein
MQDDAGAILDTQVPEILDRLNLPMDLWNLSEKEETDGLGDYLVCGP